MLHIEPLPSTISDNFMYALSSEDAHAMVDPYDAQAALAYLQGRRLDAILITHWHPDHVGGNAALLKAHPEAVVYGPADEAERIEEITGHALGVALRAGDTLNLAGATLEVLSVPGHTHGHIAYRCGDDLLSGDAIFAAGAGNVRFGGDAGVLFQTFRDVLRSLPGGTRSYPGHDYGTRNLEFALSLSPGLEAAVTALAAFQAQPARTLRVTTVADELSYNPFLRYGDPALLATLERDHAKDLADANAMTSDPEEAVFRVLRSLRDRW